MTAQPVKSRAVRRQLLFLCLVAGLLFATATSAQMISVPAKKTEPKPEPPKAAAPKPKPKAKTVVKARIQDDEEEAETPKKVGSDRFAALLFKANKGAGLNVYINDTLIGKVKAGSTRRIYVDQDDYMEIKLNDGVGNSFDTLLLVSESDKGQLITIAFPEIDYDGPRREALRQKRIADSTASAERKALADAERESRMEEARLAKELADAEKAAKIAEIKRQREEAERLRQEKLAALQTAYESSLSTALAVYTNAGQELGAAATAVKAGELTPESAKEKAAALTQAQTAYMSARKEYFDSLEANGFAETKKTYLAANIAAEKAAAADLAQAYFRKAAAGEIPYSQNLEVAFKTNRTSDLAFHLPADSMNRPFLGGRTPVEKAIEYNSDSTTLQWMVAGGAEVTNFGSRVEGKPEVYNTLLSRTVANGNHGAVAVLAKAGAQMWPLSLPKKQRKLNAAYVNALAAPHAGMKELLVKLGYDMDDGTAALEAAATAIAADMVAVQPGSFRMGCQGYDQDCSGDEKPQNKVFVEGYAIGAKEITQQQWFALMDEASPSGHKGCADCPVENVSWEEVQQFIALLNKATGRQYRLPSEAEWEYAAKGGHLLDSTLEKLPKFPGKARPDSLCWFSDNAGGASHTVATRLPNALGLYDMGGNVAEWCADFYEEAYYKRGITQNPKGPEAGDKRVYRGGAYSKSDFSIRVTNRDWFHPAAKSPELGFRLAMSTP